MNRARRAAVRIREEIPIVDVLSAYKFQVYSEDGNREQQFSCKLHGDGSDGKPSARIYPESNHFFCFACGVQRDAIALVREMEGCGFWDAVKKLEKLWGLDPLPWEPGDSAESPEKAMASDLKKALNPVETVEQALNRLDRFLSGLTQERALTPQRVAGLWEAHDRVRVFLNEGGDEGQAKTMAHKVLSAAKDALKGE